MSVPSPVLVRVAPSASVSSLKLMKLSVPVFSMNDAGPPFELLKKTVELPVPLFVTVALPAVLSSLKIVCESN